MRTVSNHHMQILKTIVASKFSTDDSYHFVILGSFGRGEICQIESWSYSDMEAFLICEDKNAPEIAKEIEKEFSRHTDINLDFGGSCYEKFDQFEPKQWVIEAALGSWTLVRENTLEENPFTRFSHEKIKDEDWILLLLNRWVQWLKHKEKDPYYTIKLWSDITSAICNLYGQYHVNISEKKRLLNDPNIEDCIYKDFGLPLTQSIYKNGNLAFNFKLNPLMYNSVSNEIDHGTIFPIWKRTIELYISDNSDFHSKELLKRIFKSYIKSHRTDHLVKHWAQDFIRDPLYTLQSFYHPELPPRWQFITHVFDKSFKTKSFSEEDYQHWERLLKNA